MEPLFIPDLGYIHEESDVWYDVGLKRLQEKGIDFLKITARNTALARLQAPFDHEINKRGNWLAQEIVFGLPGVTNPVIILGAGPAYWNPEELAAAYKKSVNLLI